MRQLRALPCRAAVIAATLSVLSTVGVVGAGAASAAPPVLRVGAHNSAVVVLQRDLHVPADGAFGPQTERAVLRFQRRHHLSADGIVGAHTWWALGIPRHRSAAPRVHYTRGARVVVLASRQVGKPYVWGAAGPRSFDCSGLVQYVYSGVGIRLPRTTWTQFADTEYLPQRAARPGDLIFTHTLSHVGIFVRPGWMYDAPRRGERVQLQRIWDPHFLVGRVR